jgi:hypothetical protein
LEAEVIGVFEPLTGLREADGASPQEARSNSKPAKAKILFKILIIATELPSKIPFS